MNVFGKNNSKAPALPKRRVAEPERHQDTYGEDDGMYEAPPCERQVPVPQIPKEENVYLERRPSPALPQRRGPPPLPHGPKSSPGDVLLNSQNMKPPDVFRTEKPGRKKMAVPVPVTPSPKPEEDLYLDICEENESSEYLYLDQEQVCSQLPSESKAPPFFKPALPTPEPMVKHPRPWEKAVSPTATAPKVEARRFSSPNVTPPVPSHRRPTSQREKLGPPEPTMKDNKPVASVRVQQGPKAPVENRQWFSKDCNRKKAEDLLLSIKKDGAFLVRNCSTQSSHQPYTLAVLYQQKVYNIPVRYLQGETPGFTLGKEGKKNEVFSSLDDMISFHKSHQLLLIDSKSQAKHTTYLTHAAAP